MPPVQGKLTSLSLQAANLTGTWGQSYSGSYSVGAPTPKTQIAGAGPEVFFGPLQPLAPVAPPGTGGRQWDYPFGENLRYIPRGDGEITFAMLRNLADNLPLLRIVIEKRKDQIAGWDWDIQPILVGKDKRKAALQGQAEDPHIKEVRQFFRYPDRRHSFHAWMRMLLEDMLVIDAACIYPRKTRGGGLYSLDVVDGSTITPLINGDGRAPLPDEGPAYQQILHGIPAADFTLNELRYLPRNPRSNRRFGISPVEQVVLTVNIALRRELFSLEYYNTGTLPDAFATLPKEWTMDQIRAFKDDFNAMMAGDLAARRQIKFMPADFKLTEVRQPPLKDQYDEWLARVICAAFAIPPSPFVNDNTRATAQTIQITASQEGIQPLQSWIKDWMDSFIQVDMGFDDLEFVWSGNDKTDPLVQAQCDASDVNAGIKSRDEVRVERGLDPYGIGPTVNGPITPLIEGYNQAVENIKNPPKPPPPALPAPGAPGAQPGQPKEAPGGAETPEPTPAKPKPGAKAGKPSAARTAKAAGSVTPVKAAGVIFLAPSGNALFLLRSKKGGDAGGTWAFPGGGVEDGETREDAAARECREEIGVDPGADSLALAHVGSNGFQTFATEAETEFEPGLNHEHDGYVWAPLSDPPSPLHPGVKETLTGLGWLNSQETGWLPAPPVIAGMKPTAVASGAAAMN